MGMIRISRVRNISISCLITSRGHLRDRDSCALVHQITVQDAQDVHPF